MGEASSSTSSGSPPKWEYRVLTDRGRMGRVTASDLDESGDEGWELVAVLRDPFSTEPQVSYYFKRPKG